jgi:hypothetical protein
VASGRMKLDDTFEVTGSLTNTIREEDSYLPMSKYKFGNIPHVEGCSRLSKFGNMPRVQELFKILKKIRAH